MKIPVKKLNTGFQMPVFGIGTWQMGGRNEHDSSNDDESDILSIRAAIDRGVTHIDTAEIYADGYSEILIGKAIDGYDRSKIFIASKVKKNNLGYENILNSCKESLRRLNTDYLDLYLLHQYNADIPLSESMRALDALVEVGLVKNIGVCNFNKEHLAEAQSYTKNKIVCNQVHYNLMFRELEESGLLKYCQDNDIFVSAWRPMGKGNLLEDIPPILKEMCDKYGKTPAQIAINWLVSQPYVITLSKTRSIDHLEENLNSFDFEMEQEDIEKLRRDYPNQQYISDAVPLA